MAGFGEESSGAGIRLSDDERRDALAALVSHREAGRLDAQDFEARQVRAGQAQTRADLLPLFGDLPDPRPAWVPALAAYTAPGTSLPAARPGLVGAARAGSVATRARAAAIALVPLAAIALFFTTPGHSWLWFLTIPAARILLGGSRRRP
jgi:Domain of unknown function (DUF1707)